MADFLNSFEFDLKDHTIRGAMPWLFLMTTFTGARSGEITDRKISDFGEEDGIHYIDIYDSKNPTSTRRVPLHPQIIDNGFPEYLKSCKAEGEWLFPALNFDKHGETSDF